MSCQSDACTPWRWPAAAGCKNEVALVLTHKDRHRVVRVRLLVYLALDVLLHVVIVHVGTQLSNLEDHLDGVGVRVQQGHHPAIRVEPKIFMVKI